MKYSLPMILVICVIVLGVASVVAVSGFTGQSTDENEHIVPEADWITPPAELAGANAAETTVTTIENAATTTILTQTRYWFASEAEALYFEYNTDLGGTTFTDIECVQRLNSTGQYEWKCELLI